MVPHQQWGSFINIQPALFYARIANEYINDAQIIDFLIESYVPLKVVLLSITGPASSAIPDDLKSNLVEIQ